MARVALRAWEGAACPQVKRQGAVTVLFVEVGSQVCCFLLNDRVQRSGWKLSRTWALRSGLGLLVQGVHKLFKCTCLLPPQNLKTTESLGVSVTTAMRGRVVTDSRPEMPGLPERRKRAAWLGRARAWTSAMKTSGVVPRKGLMTHHGESMMPPSWRTHTWIHMWGPAEVGAACGNGGTRSSERPQRQGRFLGLTRG